MKRTLLLPLLALAAAPALAARPVARWDVVPDQRVSGVFRAGVCAFHEDGVSVEFSLGGQLVCVADAPTPNPRTGVWEYVFPIDTASLPDGPIVLGARAVSLGATQEEYVLPDLPLFANGGGSLSVADTLWVDSASGDDAAEGTEAAPLATLAAAVRRIPAGGTVLLKAGEYSAGGLGGGSNRDYWTTVAAAPGVARDDVQIAKGRPGTQRLRFRGVSLYCDAESSYTAILDGENGSHSVWLDDCKTYNRRGRWAANANVFGNRYVGYVTGGLTTELNNGPDARLVRGHEVRTIASDVWTGTDKLVVNCTASDVDGGSTGAHPDFHQSHAEEPNWVHDVILYNVTGYNCKCQGLFGLRLRDSAFVNVVFERTAESDFLTQYSGPMENVLFAHVTLVNQNWLWRDGYSPVDVRVLDCCMPRMAGHDGTGTNGLLASNNFFYGANGVFGLDALSGDPLFADAANADYALRADSPALANFRPLACVPADFRGVPWPVAASGLRTLGGASSNRFDPPSDRTWPASPGDAEVCLWKDDAFAAGSITIDDNCAFDHDWWLEQTRTNGIPLTWFAITDRIGGSNPAADGTWAGWQRLVDAGHAVQSHSTNHRHADGDGSNGPTDEELHAMYRDSLAAIDAHLTHNAACCIAYPNGEPHPEIAAQYAIACRGTTGLPNEPATTDYLNVRASSSADVAPYLAVLFGETVESPAWLNKAKYRRGWFVSLVHSVRDNTNTVSALIRAFDARRPDLWVDTFPRVAKYGQERDTASLSTRSVSDERIVLNLSDGMDDALFAEPLTLKVRLPSSWTNLVATQAGAVVRATAVEHEGSRYALVDAVPDAGTVVLHNLAPPEGGVWDPGGTGDSGDSGGSGETGDSGDTGGSGLPAKNGERIKVADWKLPTPGGLKLSAETVASIHEDLKTNAVDFVYAHGCKPATVMENGDDGYGFVSGGTAGSNGGGSLFLGYDKTVYEMVREFPAESPYRTSNDIISKGTVFRRRDDDSHVAVIVFAGAYLNKANAKTFLDAYKTVLDDEYPGARILCMYSTEVCSKRESDVATYLTGSEAGLYEVCRVTPLVVHSSEDVSAPPTSVTLENAAVGSGYPATVATLTFGMVETKDPAVWIDLGPGRAAIGAEAVFSVTTQDVDLENATFAWTFGDGTTATTPTNAVAHAYAAAGAYTVAVAVRDASMSDSVSDSGGFVVAAPDVWVAAGNENAAAPYGSPATAAPDIATAVEVSADGTTIHVLDGTYPIARPVSLAFGIRLVGESGNPDAVIVTNTVTAMSGAENRGVLQIDHADAFAANLTLAGGQVYHNSAHAGGVTIGSAGGIVSNCVVSGSRANSTYGHYAGALVKAGLLTHCRLENGQTGGTEYAAYAIGAAVTGSGRIENCLFQDNTDAGQQSSVVLVDGNGSLVNCTVVDCAVKDKSEGNGDACGVRALASAARVRNVLVANVTERFSGEKRAFGGVSTNATVFAACASDLAAPVNEACFAGPLARLFRNHAGGDLRPGDPCIDRGILPDAVPAVDLAGNPRLVGSAVDIGCYEAPPRALLFILR